MTACTSKGGRITPRSRHVCETRGPAQTERLGKRLGSRLIAGDVVALTGDIGAGKTCLTRGLARGLGATSAVSSPTFVLVHRHSVRDAAYCLYHLDLYRLDSGDDLEDVGGLDLLHGADICVIEWAERAADLLPDDAFHIQIDCLVEDARRLTIVGPRDLLSKDASECRATASTGASGATG